MGAIKDFRRDYYQALTSFAKFVHHVAEAKQVAASGFRQRVLHHSHARCRATNVNRHLDARRRDGRATHKETSPNIERSLRMRERIQKIPKADPIAVA